MPNANATLSEKIVDAYLTGRDDAVIDAIESIYTNNRINFDVQFFGAVGDGLSDDTVGIQAAIDAAVAAGGGVVYFPRSTGSYLFTSLTAAGDNIEFKIEADVDVKQTVIDGFGITISGDNCSITGMGSISADVTELADYATTGSDLLSAIDAMASRRGMSRNAIISYWCSKGVESE